MTSAPVSDAPPRVRGGGTAQFEARSPNSRVRERAAAARQGRRGRLWSLMFLVHQVLGLASGLVLAVVCFTGALLVFQNEITSAMHPARNHVNAGVASIGIDSLADGAARQLGSKVTVATVSADRTRPIKLTMANGVQAYVDPYTGRIVDTQRGGERFFEVTEAIHRRLLAGEVGRRIVGVATVCFVVILLSGVVIWWPRTMRALRARITLKHPAGWKRRNYDLHVVLGIYSVVVLLPVGATGLVWSFRSVGRAVDGLTPPGKATPPPPHSTPAPGQPTISIASALHSASLALGPTTALTLYSAERPRDAIMVMGLPPDAPYRQATDIAYLDRYTGRVLRVDRFRQRPLGELARRGTNPVHVGSLYGLPSEVAAFLACLIGTIAPITGAIIWVNRKWPRALRWPRMADAPEVSS